MSPKDPKSTSSTKNAEHTKAVESPKAADAKLPKAETPVAPAHEAAASPRGKAETTIVSITVSTRLASKARLLARIRGCTISSLFTEAAARTIPAELKVALAEMKDEDIE